MRLLNIHTLELSSFDRNCIPPYAIASHRWGAEETRYELFVQKQQTTSPGYRKILAFAAFMRHGSVFFTNLTGTVIDWLWIDTCCIDKRDPNELNEAINSMFKWYARVQFCLAHLSDIDAGKDVTKSSWFDRGWTLQELLAPSLVLFLDKKWQVRGHKRDRAFGQITVTLTKDLGPDLKMTISARTHIEPPVLEDLTEADSSSFIDVLNWMRSRDTLRLEDRTHCLLGLLKVSLPLIYGEEDAAILRLLEQLRVRYDQQIRRLSLGKVPRRPEKSMQDLRREISLLDIYMAERHDELEDQRVRDRRRDFHRQSRASQGVLERERKPYICREHVPRHSIMYDLGTPDHAVAYEGSGMVSAAAKDLPEPPQVDQFKLMVRRFNEMQHKITENAVLNNGEALLDLKG